MSDPSAAQKEYRIAYINLEPRSVSSSKHQLQKILKLFESIEIIDIKSIDDPQLSSCSLLAIDASLVQEDHFQTWLLGLVKRMQDAGKIWTPAMIFADVPVETLLGLMPDTARENWYFDIALPGEISSLPIRCANLLKINEHLQELWRYEETLTTLQTKFEAMEAELLRFKANQSGPS